ncbi:uncharacterized protein TRIADDRAFT_52151 [Trichoplax adhaerens]|uniref:DH domain-containing protein n=1 Tax=Trichoplax adhaerens TaxID=10228 RepID=B3RLX0_TRIAD|nr:hypothetical protein TRIADDRAFT_52151 [Trichoplax adhaerens]EDV28860.1 hypothetical protein TRIADDRAFT_52151 [Trichoplax adhaerens]|eukprot:XP_002108062.1 hypothetical protein TRIADDRAFT_52151 [Trichoplax adhaerens]
MAHRLTLFHGCHIAFHGFSNTERQQMEENAKTQGGRPTTITDVNCTHIVVENPNTEISENISIKAKIVKQEWFWESIQLNACADELLYLIRRSDTTPLGNNSMNTPGSGLRSRKRRRGKIDLSELLTRGDSHNSLLGNVLDLSVSMLEASGINSGQATPSGVLSPRPPLLHHSASVSCCNTPLGIRDKRHTARKQVVMELLQTETNYVGILNTIINLFKLPLEQDQRGGPMLTPGEIKTIFSSIPEILDVHKIILVKILEIDNLVFSSKAEALLKAYPPFVNFFELTKETLEQCDKKYPRFHAFLKLCQNKPECGRQSLVELLIRPVQRLPSTILLLQDIMKHTSATNPDCTKLEEAISSLRNVMTHINEDKRKTEGRMQMFEIVRDIEGCPPYLLSSHRYLVMRFDMVALADVFCSKGDAMTIFLFSDSIEISKRRVSAKVTRTPSSASNYALPIGKSPLKASFGNKLMYKHVDFMPLSYVKRVVDVTDTEECSGMFAFIFRSPTDVKEKLAIFRLINNEDMTKDEILRKFTRCLADNAALLTRAIASPFITPVSGTVNSSECLDRFFRELLSDRSSDLWTVGWGTWLMVAISLEHFNLIFSVVQLMES